jgi:hypothetical protein
VNSHKYYFTGLQFQPLLKQNYSEEMDINLLYKTINCSSIYVGAAEDVAIVKLVII